MIYTLVKVNIMNLADILACPACKNNVQISTEHVDCPAFQLRFPIEEGIPVLLISRAQRIV